MIYNFPLGNFDIPVTFRFCLPPWIDLDVYGDSVAFLPRERCEITGAKETLYFSSPNDKANDPGIEVVLLDKPDGWEERAIIPDD